MKTCLPRSVASLAPSHPIRRMGSRAWHGAALPLIEGLRKAKTGQPFKGWLLASRRARCDAMLRELGQEAGRLLDGPVLIDGTWDNPHYWLRYTLLRKAAGLSGCGEAGVVGASKAKECRATFARLGVKRVLDISPAAVDWQTMAKEARSLLSRVATPQDILNLDLPFGFPSSILYDALLKHQRRAVVDIGDAKLAPFLAQTMATLHAADAILENGGYRLVIVSHAINLSAGALAWCARKRGIPTILLHGEAGVSRFVWLPDCANYFDYFGRPDPAWLETLPPARADQLAACGQAFLDKRQSGTTADLAARHAYGVRNRIPNRKQALYELGWEEGKPIIGVYSSTFFDWPHTFGLSRFRDMLDWLQAVLDVARRNPQFNWLVKAHPVEFWYGGLTLSELLASEDNGHIRLVPDDWSGTAVLDLIDAATTLYSTVGVEIAMRGLPLLLGDKGWYHDYGFAVLPDSREEYLSVLTTDWFSSLKRKSAAARRKAQLFAGAFFGCPAWQKGFQLKHDSVQYGIYKTLPELLKRHDDAIAREVDELRCWLRTGERDFHAFKMRRADGYIPISS